MKTRKSHRKVRVGTQNADWLQAADAAIRVLSYTGRRFSADEVVDRIGMPPSPNAVGVAFLHASTTGVIHHVGFAPSRNPSSNGSIIGVWKGGVA